MLIILELWYTEPCANFKFLLFLRKINYISQNSRCVNKTYLNYKIIY